MSSSAVFHVESIYIRLIFLCDFKLVRIVYTCDGSEPNALSQELPGPTDDGRWHLKWSTFGVTSLKFRAMRDGMLDSRTVETVFDIYAKCPTPRLCFRNPPLGLHPAPPIVAAAPSNVADGTRLPQYAVGVVLSFAVPNDCDMLLTLDGKTPNRSSLSIRSASGSTGLPDCAIALGNEEIRILQPGTYTVMAVRRGGADPADNSTRRR